MIYLLRAYHQPIGDWLANINPTLRKYASTLSDYGFTDSALLLAQEASDIESDLKELKVKKPHRRLIINACNADPAKDSSGGRSQAPPAKATTATAEPTSEAPPPAKKTAAELGIAEETSVPASGLDLRPELHGELEVDTVDATAWYQEFHKNNPQDATMLRAIGKGKWRKLLKACRKKQFPKDQKVYGVPMLNFMGQFLQLADAEGLQQNRQAVEELLICLVQNGVDPDGQHSDTQLLGSAPAPLRVYRHLPVVLQAIDRADSDTYLLSELVSAGADMTVSYETNDGKKSGITPLHRVFQIETAEHAQPAFGKDGWRHIQTMGNVLAQRMNGMGNIGRKYSKQVKAAAKAFKKR